VVSRYVYRNVMPPYEVEARFNTTLEPCPFCRSRSVGLFCGPLPHVSCMSCGADGPIDERKKDVVEKQWSAIVMWNIRLTDEPAN
jgi:hypothetical protein